MPLLFEVGSDAHFDRVVVVTAPPDVRRARAEQRIEQRGGRFLPDEVKIARADWAYVNDGTLTELDAFVAGVMAELGE